MEEKQGTINPLLSLEEVRLVGMQGNRLDPCPTPVCKHKSNLQDQRTELILHTRREI